jgi:aminoglycoside phosphotransferase (APT) family kinase protein
MADPFEGLLEAALRRHFGSAWAIAELARVSYGASQETWSFAAVKGAEQRPLILRRPPPIDPEVGELARLMSPGREHEVAALRVLHKAGLAVPEVFFELAPEDGLGPGFVMARLSGLANTLQILKDPDSGPDHTELAAAIGDFRGQMDAVPTEELSALRRQDAATMIADLQEILDGLDIVHPGVEYWFSWLAEHMPAPSPLKLAHGDYRLANFMVDRDGLTGVFDWELVHLGESGQDLGWVTIRSWRFNRPDLPAAGLAPREVLYDAYRAAGGRDFDGDEIRFWEVLANVKWAVVCLYQGALFVRGIVPGLEFGAIGRRVTEPLYDLARWLETGKD